MRNLAVNHPLAHRPDTDTHTANAMTAKPGCLCQGKNRVGMWKTMMRSRLPGFTEDGVEVRLLIGQHFMINADQTGLLRHLVFFKAVDIVLNFKTLFFFPSSSVISF